MINQTSSTTRAAKSYTRNQACRALAKSFEPEIIRGFLTHANKHVTRYAAHKLEALSRPTEESCPEPAIARPDTYGETLETVEGILAAKGNDLGACKRSLISRKSARTKKASARK